MIEITRHVTVLFETLESTQIVSQSVSFKFYFSDPFPSESFLLLPRKTLMGP